MDAVLDQLIRAARRCERAAKPFDTDPFAAELRRLRDTLNEVGQAFSGSWIGHHATVYIEGLRPRRPGEHFDAEWGSIGSDHTSGRWFEYSFEAVKDEVARRAGFVEFPGYEEIAERAGAVFDQAKSEVLPALDAILSWGEDAVVRERRAEVDQLASHIPPSDFVSAIRPKHLWSRDSFAMSQGMWVPPHVTLSARLMALSTYQAQLRKLAAAVRYVVTYLEMRGEMKGRTIAKRGGKVFVGHGRSAAWRDLKDLLQDRLGLEVDEFNREPTAGLSTKERLEAMLDAASFAFLVMTAEDELAEGGVQARANVIHELGLFQGRLGFERAIILLEHGCSEFSNIVGLTQIRFAKGAIKGESEEIRRVLEREGLL